MKSCEIRIVGCNMGSYKGRLTKLDSGYQQLHNHEGQLYYY